MAQARHADDLHTIHRGSDVNDVNVWGRGGRLRFHGSLPGVSQSDLRLLLATGKRGEMTVVPPAQG